MLPGQGFSGPGMLEVLELAHLFDDLPFAHLVNELDRHFVVLKPKFHEHQPASGLQGPDHLFGHRVGFGELMVNVDH